MKGIKIGDKVVCIDDTRWTNQTGIPLVYRKEYIVLDITKCKTCGKVWYNVGCKRNDRASHTHCCQDLAGAGIDWADIERFLPYVVNFKNFCRKEVIENIHEDIKKLVSSKKYEKAIETIKRLEKITNEL